MIKAIWAQSEDGVIGIDNSLPWYIPEDMKRFREFTTGNKVVMGRKTWNSLPLNFKPLPNRDNYILTHQEGGHWSSGAEVIHSIDDIPDDCWIIGGNQLYKQTTNIVDLIEVTVVDINLADKSEDNHSLVFAPNIPEEDFILSSETPWMTSSHGRMFDNNADNGKKLSYKFLQYQRR